MGNDQIRSVQGTEDVLPGQWGHWRRLYGTARRLFELYGYGEVHTPVIEDVRLFVKGTGDTTDIVQKEMYAVYAGGEDKGIALRPEGTPPVIRSYLERGLDKTDPFQKYYYIGPMFRHERPQKGRLRQFHHAGVEAVGGGSPLLDVETIALANDVFRQVGLEQFTTSINSIGCSDCRTAFRDELQGILRSRVEELCDDCRERLERNLLRIYDCKNEGCQGVVGELPTMVEFLCRDCQEHYDGVRSGLDRIGLDYREEPGLVRGLDYYTRTVYEIKHPALGARDTICGGGRYDDLVELLGGPSLPCVGFGIGVEPTLIAMEEELGEPADSAPRTDLYVVCFEEEARAECFQLVQALRAAGVAAEMDYEDRSASSQMRVADRLDAPLCFLIGGRELESGEVLIKRMSDGEQWSVPWGDAVGAVEEELGFAEGD
ncbi:MAG: histidine--tRNA ligase [Candidatus Brocadiaceae bacterium]|jgi:histidyl-tRNA synthetase